MEEGLEMEIPSNEQFVNVSDEQFDIETRFPSESNGRRR